jgi:hypothetical protein
MKTISILFALVNSLMAGLVIAFSLSGSEIRDVAPLWLATKILAGLAVIAIGGLTWLAGARPIRPSLILLAGMFLVALGAATALWTLHLALVTGDLEAYMVVYGGSLGLQGVATLWGLLPAPPDQRTA